MAAASDGIKATTGSKLHSYEITFLLNHFSSNQWLFLVLLQIYLLTSSSNCFHIITSNPRSFKVLFAMPCHVTLISFFFSYDLFFCLSSNRYIYPIPLFLLCPISLHLSSDLTSTTFISSLTHLLFSYSFLYRSRYRSLHFLITYVSRNLHHSPSLPLSQILKVYPSLPRYLWLFLSPSLLSFSLSFFALLFSSITLLGELLSNFRSIYGIQGFFTQVRTT